VIALIVNHLKLAVWLVAIVMGISLYHEHNVRIAEAALANHQIALLQAREKALSDSAHEQRTVFVRDTIKLTKVVREYKTLHDSATQHITDTVLVKKALDQADTTIKACRATVADCAALSHTLTIQLGVRDSMVETYKSLIPSTTSKVVTATKWALIGGTVGYFLVHFGVVK
jgi:HD superfamily phosphohydrolase